MIATRRITCPRCGATVRIPLYWVVGIEGIFRCPECRLRFKTGYRMGAVLSAIALVISMAVVQMLVFLFSVYLLSAFVLLMLPLWIGIAFFLRRGYMMQKMRRFVRREAAQSNASSPEDESTPEHNPDFEAEPTDALPSPRSLPKDTAFD